MRPTDCVYLMHWPSYGSLNAHKTWRTINVKLFLRNCENNITLTFHNVHRHTNDACTNSKWVACLVYFKRHSHTIVGIRHQLKVKWIIIRPRSNVAEMFYSKLIITLPLGLYKVYYTALLHRRAGIGGCDIVNPLTIAQSVIFYL